MSPSNSGSAELPVKKSAHPVLRIFWFCLSVAFSVLLVAWLIPMALKTSWSSILASLQSVPALLVLSLLLLAVLALLADSLGFAAGFKGSLKSLKFPTFLQLNAISQAITLSLPFGSTVSMGILFVRLKKLGVSFGKITTGISIASVADILALVVVSVLSLLFLAVAPLPETAPNWLRPMLLIVAIVLVALTALALAVLANTRIFNALVSRLEQVVGAFEEGLNGKAAQAEQSLTVKIRSLKEIRSNTLTQIKSDALLLLGGPILGRILQGVAFAVAVLVLTEGEVGFFTAIAIFGLTRLLAIIPLTPGGIGVVDVAMASILVFYGASSEASIVAALLFTITQVIFPAALGGILMPFGRGGSGKIQRKPAFN